MQVPEPDTLVCSDAVKFVMKLCNFVVCVVAHQKKAILCCTRAEAMQLMAVQSIACCIYNESSAAVRDDALLPTDLIRQSNRNQLRIGCWKGGQFVPIESIMSESRKRRKVSSPVAISFPSIISMETTSTSQLPTICINVQRISRRQSNDDFFERSFLFIGSLINGFLTVSFVYGLDLDAALQSCTSFLAEDGTSRVIDHQEFYVAGFFLHNEDYNSKLFSDLKGFFCKISPVFLHLSQTQSRRKSAEWWLCSENSESIKFTTQSPGWVVHDVEQDAPSCNVSAGFDVFFKPGRHSVSALDPKDGSETRISKFMNVIKDAHGRTSVPYCNTKLKALNVQERLQILHSRDLELVDQQAVVWSYIDVATCEVLHVIPLLSTAEFRLLDKNQKSMYLIAFTWMISRTGSTAIRTSYWCSDVYFGVRTAQCFMLHQLKEIRAADVPINLRQFYCSKSKGEAELPDEDLLISLIETYETKRTNILKSFVSRSLHLAHECPADMAKVIHTQLFGASEIQSFRSSMNTLPTLEFCSNSCWMETAINALFSCNVAIFRFFGLNNSEICYHLRSLFDIMCVYGHTNHNIVPTLECQRCGVYPAVQLITAPPVLGPKGYEDLGLTQWGQSGFAVETLLRLLESLELSVYQVPYVSIESWMKDLDNGVSEDFMMVHYKRDNQPSEHLEIVANYTCCAVLFGNSAHHFSVCKALLTGWTVKDAIIRECSCHATFQAALRHARQLHLQVHNYTVHTALYYRLSA
jgi:hypothetical protein